MVPPPGVDDGKGADGGGWSCCVDCTTSASRGGVRRFSSRWNCAISTACLESASFCISTRVDMTWDKRGEREHYG
jgi:hypothetical protein